MISPYSHSVAKTSTNYAEAAARGLLATNSSGQPALGTAGGYVYDLFNPAARAYAWDAMARGYVNQYGLHHWCECCADSIASFYVCRLNFTICVPILRFCTHCRLRSECFVGLCLAGLDCDEPCGGTNNGSFATDWLYNNGTWPAAFVGSAYPHMLDLMIYEGMGAPGKQYVLSSRPLHRSPASSLFIESCVCGVCDDGVPTRTCWQVCAR